MKAAVLHEYDEFLTKSEWLVCEDVPEPKLENSTDVIVRMAGVGVCRTDLHIIQGLWRNHVHQSLPHILGHENAGWVEDVGGSVKSVNIGDPVIVHPSIDNSRCPNCLREDELNVQNKIFPGINVNGGYAEYMKTNAGTLLKLPASLDPIDAAPYTDAGLTAYHVAKKASRHLLPGQYAVIIGAGGLGHIGIQLLRTLCAAEIIVTDTSKIALNLAKEVGAHYTVQAEGNFVGEILAMTGGQGAEAVIDFVGESDTVNKGLALTRRAGYYYLVGYGGRLKIHTLDMILSEKTVVGNLVGSYTELVELIALAVRGVVEMTTRKYPLSRANDALHDLHNGKIRGRAVLTP